MDVSGSDLAKRMQLAVDEAGGMSAVSAASGIPLSTLDRYVRGGAEPPASRLAEFSKACGVSVEWLLFGGDFPSKIRGEPPDNEAISGVTLIPFLNVQGSAGPGTSNEAVEVLDKIPFATVLLKKQGVSPEKAHAITARGDSMVPTILDGQVLLVDTAVRRIHRDAIYALTIDGDVLIKRVQKGSDGRLTLISDNPNYPPEVLASDAALRLKIEGRVFWTEKVL
jgi:phage repressor protein C with HTH and peptisase S24 domain